MISEAEWDFNEEGLLPYEIIEAANKGNAEAILTVVQHYESYITEQAKRKMKDSFGNIYIGVDYEIRDELRLKLMKAIVAFKISLN